MYSIKFLTTQVYLHLEGFEKNMYTPNVLSLALFSAYS